jgi:uroporphyrin-III C-methyltransferase
MPERVGQTESTQTESKQTESALTARPGKVFLIGAGPGDPELLTLRAARAISVADVIVYDHLVNPEILSHSKRGAELIYAGKRSGHHTLTQAALNRLLIERARLGETVARVKGGDPFVFGRGGEEAEALVDAGVDWEVVPGVSAGIAAAAYAGIPLTHRDYSSSVAFITGHLSPRDKIETATTALDSALSRETTSERGSAWGADTLVIYMCAATLAPTARELIDRGRAPSTPVAIVRWGTYQDQEVYRGTLADLASLDEEEAGFIQPPAIAIVGSVAALGEKLEWFGAPAVSVRDRIAELTARGELSRECEEDSHVSVRCRA